MTWERLITLEPRLQGLYEKARSYRGKRKDINRVWGGRYGLKSEMCRLVGYDMTEPTMELCTHISYEIAYRKIHNALAG